MLDMTLYEVLELTYGDEGNIVSKESGLFFESKDEVIAFTASDRYLQEFPNTPRGLRTADHSKRFKERTSKVFSNVVEYDEWSDARDTQKALDKLNPRERRLLKL